MSAKVVRIGNVDLVYPMWVMEKYRSTAVRTTARRTIGGGLVVYEQENRKSASTVTLDSMDYAWLDEATKTAIVDMANASVGQSYEIEYDDGVTDTVRFAHEQQGGAVQLRPIREGCGWYMGKIYFGKVE